MCFIRTWRNPRLRSIERAIQKNFIDSEADCCRVFCLFHSLSGEKIKLGAKTETNTILDRQGTDYPGHIVQDYLQSPIK